ncbi:hemolysin activation protein [Niallia nealsonii]|uniref:Hemolysin activation protein n=1 Tax=Niallia nealsonii TaxID=115979 RepID=A0A2N0YYN0_9BACI|nr:hemolysin activation protein [Niallia nealsonii]
MEHRVSKLEDEMKDVKTRLAVAESNIKDIKEDISSIKSNTTWLLRIVVAAIIAAIFGLILKGGV